MASTTQRGYGHRHQQLRRWWAPRVATGLVTCWRCGRLILSEDPWDLGHADGARHVYRGPEHHQCNRSTRSRIPGQGDPRPRPDKFWVDP